MALLFNELASSMKPAPRGGIGRAGNLSRKSQWLPLSGIMWLGRIRDGIYECPGVRMKRTLQQTLRRTYLDYLPEVHHSDPIGNEADCGQIVADDKECEAKRSSEFLQEVEYARSYRNIEAGGGFICNKELRLQSECTSDADASSLPTRDLVRVSSPYARW